MKMRSRRLFLGLLYCLAPILLPEQTAGAVDGCAADEIPHVVVRGETVWDLARSYDVDSDTILQSNARLAGTGVLLSGMLLCIPNPHPDPHITTSTAVTTLASLPTSADIETVNPQGSSEETHPTSTSAISSSAAVVAATVTMLTLATLSVFVGLRKRREMNSRSAQAGQVRFSHQAPAQPASRDGVPDSGENVPVDSSSELMCGHGPQPTPDGSRPGETATAPTEFLGGAVSTGEASEAPCVVCLDPRQLVVTNLESAVSLTPIAPRGLVLLNDRQVVRGHSAVRVERGVPVRLVFAEPPLTITDRSEE